MKRFVIVVMLVLLAGCTSLDEQTTRPCWFEWMGDGVETTCGSTLEYSTHHVVLWVETDDGHYVFAVYKGWFPNQLEHIDVTEAYIATASPLSTGWCDNEGDQPNPPSVQVAVREDGWAHVILDGHVTCNGVGWRYIRMVIDAEVVWMGDNR